MVQTVNKKDCVWYINKITKQARGQYLKSWFIKTHKIITPQDWGVIIESNSRHFFSYHITRIINAKSPANPASPN